MTSCPAAYSFFLCLAWSRLWTRDANSARAQSVTVAGPSSTTSVLAFDKIQGRKQYEYASKALAWKIGAQTVAAYTRQGRKMSLE